MQSLPPIAPMYGQFPDQPGKLLFTCKCQKPLQGQASLAFYQKCMVESGSKKRQVMTFDFDLKFEFTASPPSLTFEKDVCQRRKEDKATQKVKFMLESEEDLQTCRQILRSKINQRGFHEQFKPKKKIGKGNFAFVYLAEKIETGRSYAVKAFSKEQAYSEDKGKECLIKEIQIMRNIDHKFCMKLHEVYESDNSLYIVVELLEGGQLYDKIKAKYKFKAHQSKAIVFSILHGLRQMHSHGIMHRDLKPQNLIFRSQGSWDCVIADFGLAEFADIEQYLFVRCGTPGYVAPQVINIKDLKSKYNPICDVFSLGVIFYILLFGVSPFPGKLYDDVVHQNRACALKQVRAEDNPSIQPEAIDLLNKMLKKLPKERISAADALQHPYFASCQQCQEMEDTVDNLGSCGNSYPSCDSPLMTSSNPDRKMMKKDSCVDFKMGKGNVFTGKVDTVPDTGSTTMSVGKRFESVVMPKGSKFKKQA